MGCTESETLERGGLKSKLSRVKFACGFRKLRVNEQIIKNQKLLSLEFIKPTKSRSIAVEQAMIIGNTKLMNQNIIYLFLENQSKVILQRAGLLENINDLDRVKQSINSLLYASTFLKFQELESFGFTFRKNFPDYPEPKDNDISNQNLRQQKLNKTTTKSELEYIFQYSLNHGISMEHINSIGHNYKYGVDQLK